MSNSLLQIIFFLLQPVFADAGVITTTNASDSGNLQGSSEEVTVEVHASHDPPISAYMTNESGDNQESICESLCTTSFLAFFL